MDQPIQFEVLNERFTIKSKVSKEYYLHLVDYLNEKIRKIRERLPNLSNNKLVTFAALDIADECMKAKNSGLNEKEAQLLSELSDSLASAMDETD